MNAKLHYTMSCPGLSACSGFRSLSIARHNTTLLVIQEMRIRKLVIVACLQETYKVVVMALERA